MKICLMGEFSGNLDEGMRNVASCLSQELSKRHEILPLDLRGSFSTSFWKDIKAFNPQIIHYIPGPSIISFIMVKAAEVYCRDTKTVMSAMHHGFHGLRGFTYGPSYALSFLLKPLVPLFKPDLMLPQSFETERIFTSLGCRTTFLPCGVDTERFIPVPGETKKDLRRKYELDENEFIALHIGSIKNKRNIQIMQKLSKESTRILIIGSVSTGLENRVSDQLEQSGCIVWKKYIENIEEIYALADCYVFPTKIGEAAIEIPLSVLEAMSCNLPVISTRFGALDRMFEEGDGFIYAEKERDFAVAVGSIKEGEMEIKTREKVLPHTWKNVALRLEETYQQLMLESNEKLSN